MKVIVPYEPHIPGLGLNQPPVPIRPQFRGFAGNASSAASGAAAGAAAGSVVPGIGTAIGAVAGAIIGGIFGGQSNPAIQEDKTNAINLFSQYMGVQGTVSGRSIGLENMNYVWRGACFEGHFPDWNNETELPDSAMSMPGSPYGNNGNCFGPLWVYAQKGAPSPSYPKITGNGGVPVTDAKTFVDNYFWPSNSAPADTNPWATNTDAVGKQVIYDCADAFIATQISNSVPYIANPPAKTTTTTAPATATASTNVIVASCKSTAPATTYSVSGSYLVIGSNTSQTMITASGTWGQDSAGGFTLNGVQHTAAPTTTSEGSVGLYWDGGQVYVYNSDGTEYVWQNGGWVASTNPTPPAAITQAIAHYASVPAATPSSCATKNAVANATPQQPPTPTAIDTSDGSEITGPGTAVETAAGTLLYLGPQAAGNSCNVNGYPIWEKSSTGVTQEGYAVGLVVLNGGQVYAVNALNLWSQWTGSGWQQLSGPPTVTTNPVTTSTTVAAQAGLTCTGSTPVVSNAFTCDESSPAASTTAAVTAAPTSSDLGYWIVGGGVVALGLLWWLNNRKRA
jgi:hypothetical protein